MAVQCLRLSAPKAERAGLIPSLGRFHVPHGMKKKQHPKLKRFTLVKQWKWGERMKVEKEGEKKYTIIILNIKRREC